MNDEAVAHVWLQRQKKKKLKNYSATHYDVVPVTSNSLVHVYQNMLLSGD
jgi:hypothetical protein